MCKIIARTALVGMLGLLVLVAPQAQENQAGGPHATGLIPLDARQVEEIVARWPRISRVGINTLGFERVNAVRAGKGKPSLDLASVQPVGAEVESAPAARGAIARTAAANADMAADLPVSVDNSLLRFFPPIRNQGSLGACVSFASTYTQLSYMTAFQRNLDIRDTSDNTNKYSPKWTYNMVDGGENNGSSFYENYAILEKHGAATWAEFPYDTDFRAWCLNPAAWRNALGARTNVTKYVYDASTDLGLEQTKELLTDGYVLVFGTYISSWDFKTVTDDTSTSADDAAVGKAVAYWLNGSEGGHAMTIVGYNDAIWTDVNANGAIDAGEKGAFRIANSWGTGWGDGGFTWLAYDALRSVSAVPEGPSTNRVPAFQSDMIFVLTARNGYVPMMTGEFTINLAKRYQMRLSIGRSSTSTTVPTTTWFPAAFQNQGGAYAFDGSTTALSGTFVLDLTDVLAAGAGPQRYYLGLSMNVAGDPATLSAFKIVDTTTDPDTESVSSVVPLTSNGQQVYSYVDYAYLGPDYNDFPALTSPQVNPASGRPGDTFTFYVRYYDQDGDVPAVKNIILDGTPHAMTLLSGQPPASGWYEYEAVPAAGSHTYSFYFEDGRGGSAVAPIAGALGGPEVYSCVLSTLSPSSAPTCSPAFVLTVTGSDFALGDSVTWDGNARSTTFVSSSRLDATIGAGDLTPGRSVPVAVRSPGGGFSNMVAFTVNNPRPTLASVSPSAATGGGTGLALTLHGSDFVSNSAARWNGVNKTTTYVSATEIRTSLSASDLLIAGEYELSVTNPIPAGGASVDLAFAVSDFTMSDPPSDLSVAAGQSATCALQVTPRYGSFDSAVSFSCTGLPRGCTASFSPSSVTPGASAATTTLTLKTKGPQTSGSAATLGPAGLLPPALGGLLLAALLLALAYTSELACRTKAGRRLASAALILLIVCLAGCSAGGGGNSQDTVTPAGTYQITAHAISGNLAVQTQITLIVH